jgi:protein involved in polysaccharide export with SLBB domain
MDSMRRSFIFFLLVVFVVAVVDLPLAMAQQQTPPPVGYRVGAGDRIFLSVPQRQDLNRELIVGEGGIVELPLIGAVDIGGRTATEIETRLLQAIQDYYPSITDIDVTVTKAMSQVIYVSGQVRTPGKYTFTTPPKVWEAIREAGGPLPTASLDNVRIIKDRSRGGTSYLVNVQAALEGGSIEDLPDLEAGDTIIIPAREMAYTGEYGVNVIGAVVRPGVYRLQARQDLVSAVLLAGGPIEEAAITKISIIRPNGDGTVSTVEIDLKKYLEHGDPFSNPKLLPGDTVHVPRSDQWTLLLKGDLGLILSFVTTAITLTTLLIALTSTND